MAFANFGPVTVPVPLAFNGVTPVYRAILIDATAEKVAAIIRAPKTGTLDKFEFFLGTVTQAPASGLKCSFQDVDLATGAPDGTADQYRVVTAGLTTNTWVAPGLMTSDGTDGGAKRSVTQGDRLACVIEFQSWASGDSLNVNMPDVSGTNVFGTPENYALHYTASWAQPQAVLGIALKYNDGTYGYIPNCHPASAINTVLFDSSTTPDEIGLIFTPTVPVKIYGAWIALEIVANRDVDVVLYDADGSSPLETVELDMNVAPSTTPWVWCPFSSAYQLAAGSAYRITVLPETTNGNRVYTISVASNAILDTMGGGATWYRTQRTNAGAWTDTNTQRPFICPVFSAFSDGVGGGLLTHPGLAGGMRG